ncbi:tRNA (cytosine(34)-C(5))-methyltransferase, mitochondrial [Aulostomus maculatus]
MDVHTCKQYKVSQSSLIKRHPCCERLQAPHLRIYLQRNTFFKSSVIKDGVGKVTKIHKKKRSACQTMLDHFDWQYGEELGDLWTSARAVLLDRHSWQYGVLLNRFTAVAEVKCILQSQGFSTLLPQIEASTLPCEVDSSKSQSEKACLLSTPYITTYPSDDPQLRPVSSSHVLSQQLQSEPSPRLPGSSLQCYIHPSAVRLPTPAYIPGQLKEYYLLNAASLLPVLALQVRDGERVLDLCSAPGGKALAIMQCATPAFLCCNEPKPHRRDWLAKTLESFLPHSLNSRVFLSALDGRAFGRTEAGIYDKVLVDAPCSNDRSWLYSSDDQQVEQRLKERESLPALQVQLLRQVQSALSAVRPGGVVVYSTCTLSSSENYAVVEKLLSDSPEAEPEDLWEEIAVPLSNYFTFSQHQQVRGDPSLLPPYGAVSSYDHKLGILVVPQPGRTWGPMFLSRIRKKK